MENYNIADEKWETVKGFPNYMISSESRVLRKDTMTFKSICYNKRFKFRYVRLHNEARPQGINIPLYRLKAIAFIPNPENKREVNHKYGDRMDEDISSLEWSTPKENMKHSFNTGLAKGQFEMGVLQKLSVDDVKLIRLWYASGFIDFQKASKIFNSTPEHIRRVAKRKILNHV